MAESRGIRQKGAFLLPNALTTSALFAGVYSIISGINGQYEAAAIAIFVAGVLDGLDGRVARLTNTQSEFGVQYDSLADMISFCLAPALLAFNWSLQSLGDISPLAGKLGWLAAFVYIACGALRLARFNSQAGKEDKSFFQGLASPAAALMLAVIVWFFVDKGVAGSSVSWLIWFATASLGILMFSNVRYYSFKSVPAGEKVPLFYIFGVVLVFVLFALDPPFFGLVVGCVYICSGIVITLVGRRKRMAWRARRRKLQQQRAESDRIEPNLDEAEKDR